MPLQSVDGNSCADGYMFDPDHDSSDPSNYGFMAKCVPNPDYNPPPLINDEALLQALDTIDDLLDTIDELESSEESTSILDNEESTSILDNSTILLIIVVVLLIILIRTILGNRNN